MDYIEIQEEQREDERGCVGNENTDVGGYYITQSFETD